MSNSTYVGWRHGPRKAIAFLHGEIKSPPFSKAARVRAGCLLDQLQNGERIGMPQSRPMPTIGSRCHELRVHDHSRDWRIIYRIDEVVILIVAVFQKKTKKTPRHIIDACERRLRAYDRA